MLRPEFAEKTSPEADWKSERGWPVQTLSAFLIGAVIGWAAMFSVGLRIQDWVWRAIAASPIPIWFSSIGEQQAAFVITGVAIGAIAHFTMLTVIKARRV